MSTQIHDFCSRCRRTHVVGRCLPRDESLKANLIRLAINFVGAAEMVGIWYFFYWCIA